MQRTARSPLADPVRVILAPPAEYDVQQFPDSREWFTTANTGVAVYDFGQQAPWLPGPPPTYQGLINKGRHFTTFGFNNTAETLYIKVFKTGLFFPFAGQNLSSVTGGTLFTMFPVPAGATFNFDMQFDWGPNQGLRFGASSAANMNQYAADGGGWTLPTPEPTFTTGLLFTSIIIPLVS